MPPAPPAPPASLQPAQPRQHAFGLAARLGPALARSGRLDLAPPARARAGLSRSRFIEAAPQDVDRVESCAQDVRRLRAAPRTPPRRKGTP